MSTFSDCVGESTIGQTSAISQKGSKPEFSLLAPSEHSFSGNPKSQRQQTEFLTFLFLQSALSKLAPNWNLIKIFSGKNAVAPVKWMALAALWRWISKYQKLQFIFVTKQGLYLWQNHLYLWGKKKQFIFATKQGGGRGSNRGGTREKSEPKLESKFDRLFDEVFNSEKWKCFSEIEYLMIRLGIFRLIPSHWYYGPCHNFESFSLIDNN